MADKMNTKKIIWGSLILAGVLFSGAAAGNVKADSAVTVTEIEDEKEISQLISDTWEEDYFEKIVVDPDTGNVQKDGEKETFSAEFDVSRKEADNILNSQDGVEEFLEEQESDTVYEVEENEEGDYEITAPYQTKRIIITSPLVQGTFGASEVYKNSGDGEIILQFETEEATEKAYKRIVARYGNESCYVDEIIYFDDISCSTEEDVISACYSWGNEYMGMDSLKSQAAASGYNRQVTVAVIDSGVDTTNFMFAGNRISGKSYSFVTGNRDLSDYYGHGTHVAGIIADATPSNVKIMMLRITNNEGRSSLFTMKTALNYAINQKADVINMSMGVIGEQAVGQTFLNNTIRKAYYKGIPLCASAGNKVSLFPSVNVKYCYPANTSWPITVSALDNSSGKFADYSFRGSAVDFAAPGSSILSAKSSKSKPDANMDRGNCTFMWGTSMAAPHISAAAAYLKMIQPDLSVQGIVKELKKRSVDLGKAGKDSYYGWGCPKMTGLFNQKLTYSAYRVKPFTAKTVLTSVKNAAGGVQITWNKVVTADTYRVYRKTPGGTWKYIGKTGSRKFVDKKAAQGKKYIYAVRAYRCGDKGTLSAEKSLISLKRVTGTKAETKSGRKAVLTWKKQKKVSGYQIRYSYTKDMKKTKTVTIRKNQARKVLNGLKKKTCYYQVRAWRKYGGKTYYSAWSAKGKFTVK